jgi:uncharacterized membrane protein YqjE
MANGNAPNGNAQSLSLSEALERVIQRSQQALLAQFELLRIEAEEDLSRTLEAAALLMGGLLVLATAWLSLMVLAIHLLRQPLSLAASLALVGGFNVALGTSLVVLSIRTLRRLRLMRPDSVDQTAAEPASVTTIVGTVPEQRQVVVPALEQSERELKRTFDDLLATIHSRLDFGQRIVERPVPWVVGSLVFGFLLGQPRGR